MIVAAYPCTGKTTLASRNWKNNIDLESSNFSQLGNENWAKVYAAVAKDLHLQHASIFTDRNIFVSTHPDVIKELEHDNHFMLVFPALSLKDEMIKRATERVNNIKERYEVDKSAYDRLTYKKLNAHLNEEDETECDLQIASYERYMKSYEEGIAKNERALVRIRDHYEEDIENLMKYECNKYIFTANTFYVENLFGEYRI